MNKMLIRGQRADNGEWVQSCCILRVGYAGETEFYLADIRDEMELYFGGVTGNILSIPECNFYKVKPETVNRSIDQHDKNGRLLFENDIVKLDGKKGLYRIIWMEYCAQFAIVSHDEEAEDLYFCSTFEIWDGTECEWAGIHIEEAGSDAE